MTCKPRLAAGLLPLALVIGSCGGANTGPDVGDWRAMLRRGDGIGAEIALRRELDAGTPRGELAPFLGEAELLQGNGAEAHRWLDDGAFAPPVAAHGFHMLGRVRMVDGDLPAAGKAFDRALAAEPNDPELWNDIGRLRWRGGEQAQAVAAARKAVALGPENASALLLAAQLAREAEGGAVALGYLERGLAAAPDDPDLLGEYAATLGELGRVRDSVAAVRRLAAVDPGNPRVLFLQAVIAARAGRLDLARRLLQRGGDLDRNMPAAILLLAVIDMDNGNYASAAQGLDGLLARQPDNRRAQMLLARALLLGGNARELLARFGDRPQPRYIAVLVGHAYETVGDRRQAARYLDRARTPVRALAVTVLKPSRPLDVAELRGISDGGNAVALVRGQIGRGATAVARTEAAAFLRRFPGSSDAMALAGDAALAAGDPQGALRFYRQAAGIRRPWPLVKRMVAAFDASRDTRGAVALLESFAAGEPNNADAARWLARHREAVRGS